MIFREPKNWGVAFGAGLLATVSLLPQARAELVYEDAQSQAQTQQANDREALRSALSVSEKAQVTTQVQAPAAAPAPQLVAVPAPAPLTVPAQQPVMVVPAPVAAAPSQTVVLPPTTMVAAPITPAPAMAPTPASTADNAAAAQAEVQNLSKTELLRRERVREEVKNEDLLQERLEQLRLRDENRRTQLLLGINGPTGEPDGSGVGAPLPGGPVPVAPMKQEVVVAPVTDHPGVVATAPAVAPIGSPGTQVVMANDQIGMTQAMAVSANTPSEERTLITVSPRFGISTMNVNNMFNVDGHFATGVQLGMATSDNLGFFLGYTYAEYGIQMNQQYNPYYSSLDALIYKQNIFEGGVKMHLLGPDAKINPYGIASFGYELSYLNYNESQRLLNMYGAAGQPYSASGILGSLGAGVDMKVGKNVSVGAEFKYTNTFSYRENGDLNYGMMAMDPTREAYGASLAQSSFYSILGGLNFTF
jgi:hypothetical protein